MVLMHDEIKDLQHAVQSTECVATGLLHWQLGYTAGMIARGLSY